MYIGVGYACVNPLVNLHIVQTELVLDIVSLRGQVDCLESARSTGTMSSGDVHSATLTAVYPQERDERAQQQPAGYMSYVGDGGGSDDNYRQLEQEQCCVHDVQVWCRGLHAGTACKDIWSLCCVAPAACIALTLGCKKPCMYFAGACRQPWRAGFHTS